VYLFIYLFISLLCMLQATQCSSSGESNCDIYQMMYRYNSILLMMSTWLLKTCREVK